MTNLKTATEDAFEYIANCFDNLVDGLDLQD
jgi:hypothetical protein